MQTKSHYPLLLVALAAVAALTFGTSEVMAANAAVYCAYDPPTQLGECVSAQQCQLHCQARPGGDEGSVGVCNSNNCCICYL